ncbi:hypothetical protein BCR34DRAFT_581374 [Clohesyomyces aquaticus]|uniref:Major facilitator superfamily domain-containing protein n=1 Tax=Clohesyomyces aquaticus TaxID=1231657 RepID=A0A1Y1Y0Z3_9PLEO|nr:hypothetical protein BCR34DRAFT_581374 [Clohesyomyces aquaticus]
MGPLGGLVYTAVAYACLQDSQFKKACYTNGVISAVTLIPAWLWIKPSTLYPRSFPLLKPMNPLNYSPTKDQGGLPALILFFLGYICLFFGLFTWPTFLPLLVASMPSPSWPTHGSIVLMIAFGIAALTAPLATSQYNLRSQGPLNTFILATLLTGLGFLAPSQSPTFLTGAVCAIPFGLGLGAILGLYLRVTSVFLGDIKVGNHRDTAARAAMLMTLAGISATVGVVVTAVVVEMGVWGFQIAMLVNGVVVLFGAVLLWVARWLKAGKKLWYCI